MLLDAKFTVANKDRGNAITSFTPGTGELKLAQI